MRQDDNFNLVVLVLCAVALSYFIGMFYVNTLQGGL